MARVLRALVPFAVTVAILYEISRRVDVARAFDRVQADTLLILIPALAAYGVLSLCIDAISLARASATHAFVPMARLKAATYPLGLVHHALGVGALIVLLRRRAGLALADATAVVMLISGLDLLALLTFATVGAAWLTTEETTLRLGVVAGLLLATALGLFFVRSSMGQSRLLRAIRELPTPRLARLMALRLLFIATFLALGGAALASFGIHPPLDAVAAGFAQIALVSAIPIAVAGLGTGQAAFLFVFRAWAPPEQLLGCSLAFSAGIIVVRVALGVACAGEFSRGRMSDALDAET